MKLWPNFAPVQNRISGVKTHHLRGRDAGHFGRWLGARSDVIRSASLRLQRKSPLGSSKGSTVFPDTLFARFLPGERFWLQRGSWK